MAERGFSVRHMPGFALVATLCFVALYAPLLILAVYSFNSGDGIGAWLGFSLRWYEVAWANQAVQDVTLRSIDIAVVAMVISTIVATMAALATTRTQPFRGMGLIDMMINQPLMVPEI